MRGEQPDIIDMQHAQMLAKVNIHTQSEKMCTKSILI